MRGAKRDNAAVKTFADHEVIVTENKLRHVIMPDTGSADDDPVARAEQALAAMSNDFPAWMELECERLVGARNDVRTKGMSALARDTLFRAAHDIKGEGATFGFPMAALAAESLCRLIEHTRDASRIPLDLIDQHVDAVRAIVREKNKTEAEVTAVRLSRRLREVTDEFLREDNKDRLHELDGVLSPPLAPAKDVG